MGATAPPAKPAAQEEESEGRAGGAGRPQHRMKFAEQPSVAKAIRAGAPGDYARGSVAPGGRDGTTLSN